MKRILKQLIGVVAAGLVCVAACFGQAAASSPNNVLAQLGVAGVTDQIYGTNPLLYANYLIKTTTSGVFHVSVMPAGVVASRWNRVMFLDSINGNDTATNSGSAGLPFKTFASAVSNAVNNTVFVLAPGSYVGPVITNSITRMSLVGLDPTNTFITGQIKFNNDSNSTIDIYGVTVNDVKQSWYRALTAGLYDRARVTTLTRQYPTSINSPLVVYRDPSATLVTPIAGQTYATDVLTYDATNIAFVTASSSSWWTNTAIPSNVTFALDKLAARMAEGTNVGQMLYWNGTNWNLVASGTTNTLLSGGSVPAFRTFGEVCGARDVPYDTVGSSNNWIVFVGSVPTNVQQALDDIADFAVPRGTNIGQMAYWNGTNWDLMATGTISQVLYGGVKPAFGGAPTGTVINGVSPGNMLYWDGAAWALVSSGAVERVLFGGGTPTWGSLILIDPTTTNRMGTLLIGDFGSEMVYNTDFTIPVADGWTMLDDMHYVAYPQVDAGDSGAIYPTTPLSIASGRCYSVVVTLQGGTPLVPPPTNAIEWTVSLGGQTNVFRREGVVTYTNFIFSTCTNSLYISVVNTAALDTAIIYLASVKELTSGELYVGGGIHGGNYSGNGWGLTNLNIVAATNQTRIMSTNQAATYTDDATNRVRIIATNQAAIYTDGATNQVHTRSTNDAAAYADRAVTNWSYYPAVSNVVLTGVVDIVGSTIEFFDSTARDSNRGWWPVASSRDGTRLVAGVNGGKVYISTDSGATWTAYDSDRSRYALASSEDGSRLVCASDYIYTSDDGGTNWVARDDVRDWTCVASSGDGTRLVAGDGAGSGDLYISTDGGTNWTGCGLEGTYWLGLASSVDGVRLAATDNGGEIYTSDDGGTNWNAWDSVRDWQQVASSTNGMRLVATVSGGQIYTSTDGGENWVARDSVRAWFGVASSANGVRLVATTSGGQIYTSNDGGTNWTARESNRNWCNVAASYDGTKLVAVVDSGKIYTMNWYYYASSIRGIGNILPAVADTFDLGSAAYPFRSLYVGGGTIYMNGNALGVDGDGNLTYGNMIIVGALYTDIATNNVCMIATNQAANIAAGYTDDSIANLHPADNSTIIVQNNKLVVSPMYWTELVLLQWQQLRMWDLGAPYNMISGQADDYTNQAWMDISLCSGQLWSGDNYGYYGNNCETQSSVAFALQNTPLDDRNYALCDQQFAFVTGDNNVGTLSVWHRFDSMDGNATASFPIGEVGDGGGGWDKFNLNAASGGGIGGICIGPGYAFPIWQGTSNIWVHIVVVSTGGWNHIYTNGVFDQKYSDKTYNVAQSWYLCTTPDIGAGYQSQDCTVDDVAIWTNQALTNTEIEALWAAGVGLQPALTNAPYDSPNLCVLWHFNEGSSLGVVSNYSSLGAAYNCTLTGPPDFTRLAKVPSAVDGPGVLVYSNMVLISTNFVVPVIPTNGTVAFRIEPLSATRAVTNVDLLGYISVDVGLTWNAVNWDYQAPIIGNESVIHGTWTATNGYGDSNIVYKIILTNAPAQALQERIHAGAFSYTP